eukprot:2859538-Pleurochrysis_carterae.AAC.1
MNGGGWFPHGTGSMHCSDGSSIRTTKNARRAQKREGEQEVVVPSAATRRTRIIYAGSTEVAIPRLPNKEAEHL